MTNSSLDLEASVNALVERLEVIEVRYRRLRAALFAVVGALAIVGLSAATSSRPLTTSQLAIVDARGRERIQLGTYAATNTPYIYLNDSSGTHRIRLWLDSAQAPGLELNGSDGTRRVNINAHSTAKDRSANVYVYDAAGNQRAALAVSITGEEPGLAIFDPSKGQRIYTGEYTDGTYGLSVKSSSGTFLWSAPPQ